MSTVYRISMLLTLIILITACSAPATSTPQATQPPSGLPEVKIARHPKPADFNGFNVYTQPPQYDPDSTEQWQVDLRSSDLTKLDLSKSKEDLLFADFDSKTQWPTADKMPADFDWQKIMEVSKDPGLGIRDLHKQGITGSGIGLAIIDQPLLIEHQEYKDRFRLYEEINVQSNTESQMHGPAVTSIAVGKTVGVAPEADLYYIGSWTGDFGAGPDGFKWNFKYYAQAVHRILEINQSLPADRKIRVITMQVGWGPDQEGYDEITAAVEDAKEAGIFVISSSLSETYGLNFHGLGRDPLSDPNKFENYQPGSWWQDQFYEGGLSAETLLVPMDARTTASPTGSEDYVYYRQGGWSWSIPYLGGMYVLAAQVKPDITPEEFWNTALQTGKTIELQQDGKGYEFGVILDPQALIEALQNK